MTTVYIFPARPVSRRMLALTPSTLLALLVGPPTGRSIWQDL